jgi:hypothetical protein
MNKHIKSLEQCSIKISWRAVKWTPVIRHEPAPECRAALTENAFDTDFFLRRNCQRARKPNQLSILGVRTGTRVSWR